MQTVRIGQGLLCICILHFELPRQHRKPTLTIRGYSLTCCRTDVADDTQRIADLQRGFHPQIRPVAASALLIERANHFPAG
mgnify:CR=1 FL=1